MKIEKVVPVKRKIRLTVLTPTAVTTGEEYFDIDFVVKNNEFLFIGSKKLANILKREKKIEEFYNLLSSVNERNIQKLRRLINTLVLEEDVTYRLPADADFIRIYQKNLTAVGEDLRVLNRLRVRRIFRNPLNNNIYIPGSTIKGAIRTAIINSLIQNRNDVVERIKKILRENESFKEKKKKITREIDSLLSCNPNEEIEELFKTGSMKDVMRFIKVSDLREVEAEVRVGRSFNFNPALEENKLSIPTNLEYINSGVFEGEIVVYPDYLRSIFSNCSADLNFVKLLRKHYHRVFNREKERFRIPFEVSLPDDYRKSHLKSLIKIGFHAGALSKTVADDSIRRVKVHPGRRSGFKSQPATTWVINGKPMGWALLEVLD